MLQIAIAGIEALAGVSAPVKRAAVTNLKRWLDDVIFEDYRASIISMVEKGQFDLLVDAFYQVIPFGTGGRRGPVGVGPNRINPWTIATSVQGHVGYLRGRFGDGHPLSVVIAYDVRAYNDRRGHYDAEVALPVRGWTSRDFAELAARVYAANGVVTHIQPRGEVHYMSTPELAFAIRHLSASAGLNVSASHNHPDDNGGKFYNHLGGQEIPPDDEALVNAVALVGTVETISWEDAVASPFVSLLSKEVYQGYIAHIVGHQTGVSPSADVVFTGLHGTGTASVVPVLRAAGFSVTEVAEQASTDGDFPTVPFRAPNPEVPQSMDFAVTLAKKVGADIVMATDPDADRIGAVVQHLGTWRALTGNEIATLVVDHALTQWKGAGRPLVVQTEVTTGFIGRMARARGADVIDHLLVGFKYIGDVNRQIEEFGAFGEMTTSLSQFVAGVEESHGVLISQYIRDKDAAGGALYLAEAASLAKARGETLVDRLEQLWSTYGYVTNKLVSTVMQGAAGRAQIEAVQQSFRDRSPPSLAGLTLTGVADRQDTNGVFGAITSGTNLESRNVMVFSFGDEARVILRPSGTEPKNKAYVEVRGSKCTDLKAEISRVESLASELSIAFVDEMLSRVDLELPRWAHEISGLVPVESKVAFVETLATLVSKLMAGEHVERWLAEELSGSGADATGLFREAVIAYLEQESMAVKARSKVEALFGI
jgi:phosphoglucomutase